METVRMKRWQPFFFGQNYWQDIKSIDYERNAWIQCIRMAHVNSAKLRAVIDAAKAHYMHTHEIILQAQRIRAAPLGPATSELSSHLVIHANRYIVASTNPSFHRTIMGSQKNA